MLNLFTADSSIHQYQAPPPIYTRLTHPLPAPSHANYPFHTPGGGDKRWLGSDEVEEEGLQWVGGLMSVQYSPLQLPV